MSEGIQGLKGGIRMILSQGYFLSFSLWHFLCNGMEINIEKTVSKCQYGKKYSWLEINQYSTSTSDLLGSFLSSSEDMVCKFRTLPFSVSALSVILFWKMSAEMGTAFIVPVFSEERFWSTLMFACIFPEVGFTCSPKSTLFQGSKSQCLNFSSRRSSSWKADIG